MKGRKHKKEHNINYVQRERANPERERENERFFFFFNEGNGASTCNIQHFLVSSPRGKLNKKQ